MIYKHYLHVTYSLRTLVHEKVATGWPAQPQGGSQREADSRTAGCEQWETSSSDGGE